MIKYLIIGALLASVPCEQLLPQGSASRTAVFNVLTFGAVGDGVVDDTDALEAAAESCSTWSGILYIPHSTGDYRTSKTLELPPGCDLQIDGTLVATAPMEAVIAVGATGTAYRHRIFGTGIIDSGNIAKRHISLLNYGHFTISGITLLNGAAVAGIDVGPEGAKGGYEAYIHDLNLFVPQGVPSIPGNAGIWIDKGTDSSVYNLAIAGWDTGVRNSTHNNQPFENLHVWGFGPNPGWKNISNLPSICFDDRAGDAQWIGDECDTPTEIGLRAHGYNDQITGFSCFNNEIWGKDDVVNCIQFDLPKPYSSVISSIFQGHKGHRLASDVAVAGDNYTAVTFLGNVTISNVVKTRAMTPHFSSVVIENTLLLDGPLGRIGGSVVLPPWVNAYAGGGGDKLVQLATGAGGSNHLPVYGRQGGLMDSGKELTGIGEFVPAVGKAIGCLDGWDHLPCLVARIPPETLTAIHPIPPTYLFTTTAPTGVYQVTVTFRNLAEAASGTATPTALMGQIHVSGAAASLKVTEANGISTATATGDAGPDVTLGFALSFSNAGGAARYRISAEVLRLQ